MADRGLFRNEDGHYVIRYELPRAPDGKRKRKYETLPGMGKKEALAYRAKRQAELKGRTSPDAGTVTLAKYLDVWLNGMQTRIEPTTAETYRIAVERHIKPGLGHVRLDRLQTLDIQAFYDHLVTVKGLSAKSVKNVHGILRGCLHQAVKYQVLLRNPADYCDLPKRVLPDIKVATQRELSQLVENGFDGSKYRLPVLLAIATGMRRGELLGLQWQDFDADRRVLIVRRALAQLKGKVFEKTTKTGRVRVVQLAQGTVDLLNARQAELGTTYKPSGWICSDDKGNCLKPRAFSKAFSRYKAVHDLSTTLHGLRHSHASLLLAAGLNIKVVAERLGHTTTVTTDRYIHLLPNMQDEAADVMDRLLRSYEENGKDSGPMANNG